MELRDALRKGQMGQTTMQSSQKAHTPAYVEGMKDAYGDVGGGLPYLSWMEAWPSLEWSDYTGDAQSPSNKPLGTADAPPTKPEPETSEAKPKSYTALTTSNPLSPSGKSQLELMIKLNQLTFLNQFDPDYYSWVGSKVTPLSRPVS